jgi:hypothetical protein
MLSMIVASPFAGRNKRTPAVKPDYAVVSNFA